MATCRARWKAIWNFITLNQLGDIASIDQLSQLNGKHK